MYGHCGYSAACIPGKDILVSQLCFEQLILFGPLLLVGSRVLRVAPNLLCVAADFVPSISSPSLPRSGDMEEIFANVLAYILGFFSLLCLAGSRCILCSFWAVYVDISAGSTRMRRFTDQSLVISSKSSFVSL
jgi:hypothetical protein